MAENQDEVLRVHLYPWVHDTYNECLQVLISVIKARLEGLK